MVLFAILPLIWLQIGWIRRFFTIPLSRGNMSKSSSGKKWTALSLFLAGWPIFYTGWAPPDFNGVKIAMYRRGVCLPAATGNVPGLRRDSMEIDSLKSKLLNLRRLCRNEMR